MPTPRGPSSRDILSIQWDFPVHLAPKPKDDGDRTRAVMARHALSQKEALAEIAGDDPRPLLVLRECLTCNGTDDALLTRQENNERTFLLSRWFHCVKLAPSVIETDHPFHALFAGESPAHLFVAQRNGALRTDLKGDQSRAELWKAMNGTLAQTYDKVSSKGPKQALAALGKLLDKLDVVDEDLALQESKYDRELESTGAASRKAEKLVKKIKNLRADRAALRAQALKVSVLKLRSLNELAENEVGAAQ